MECPFPIVLLLSGVLFAQSANTSLLGDREISPDSGVTGPALSESDYAAPTDPSSASTVEADRAADYPQPTHASASLSTGSGTITCLLSPARPEFSRVPAGQFYVRHEFRALDWVREDQAGVLLSFDVSLPASIAEREPVSVKVFIYDIAGNRVHAAYCENTTPQLNCNYPNSGTYPVYLYWNGSNSDGLPVAPGLYRAIVLIDSHLGQRREEVTVGITR
jgi:hypothetical protein